MLGVCLQIGVIHQCGCSHRYSWFKWPLMLMLLVTKISLVTSLVKITSFFWKMPESKGVEAFKSWSFYNTCVFTVKHLLTYKCFFYM